MRITVVIVILAALFTSCAHKRVGNIIIDSFIGVTMNYQLIGWKQGKKNLYPVHLRSKVTGTTVKARKFNKLTMQIVLANKLEQHVNIYWIKNMDSTPMGQSKQIIYSGKDRTHTVSLNLPFVKGNVSENYLVIYAENSPYPVFISPKIKIDG